MGWRIIDTVAASPPAPLGRLPLFRICLAGAVVYTLAMGAWAILFPHAVFDVFGLPHTFWIFVLDDLVWLVPFTLYLADTTSIAAWVRRRAAWICAAMNALAVAGTGLLLLPGTEAGGNFSQRAAYIAQHRAVWSAGWAMWSVAAVTLVGFYAWWASRLPRGWQPVAAFMLAGLGILGDVLAESLLIGWLPEKIRTAAPAATFLTGAYANGLYTIAGIWLTLQTTAIRGWLRGAAWVMWGAGILLTVCVIQGWFTGVAIITAVLFVIFCPWVVLVSRRL